MQRSELTDPKASILKTETLFPRPLFHQESKGQEQKGGKNAELEQGYETCTKWTVMDLKPAKQKHKSFSILVKSLSPSLSLSLSLSALLFVLHFFHQRNREKKAFDFNY